MKHPLVFGFTVFDFTVASCTIALVAFVDMTCTAIAVAKTPAEIKNIARSSTVEIKLLTSNTVGSGVIVHRQGDLYTLVTNRHVVCGNAGSSCKQPNAKEIYRLGLADGQKYQLKSGAAKLLGKGLDLAIIQFRSKKNYAVATIDITGKLKNKNVVYTSGFPSEEPGFSFNVGKALAVANKRIAGDRGGYSIIYDAYTLPGMSGGGVFNSDGQLVAIHGLGDRYTSGTEILDDVTLESLKDFFVNDKTGYNRGIPIRWIVQSLGERGIKVGSSGSAGTLSSNNLQLTTTADEYFIAGFNKYLDPGENVLAGKKQAIQDFNKAIQINPQYAVAYFSRSSAKGQIRDVRGALADINQAIAIDPNFAEAYLSRASIKNALQDQAGALADVNQAIKINPNFSEAYLIRAAIKNDRNDFPGVFVDLDSALLNAPKYLSKRQYKLLVYIIKGGLKFKVNDLNSALSDMNTVINLDPENYLAYIFRGAIKMKINDIKGASSDLEKAIKIKPKAAYAYALRSGLKLEKFNDINGALADVNLAISLDPKLAMAYVIRGTIRLKQNDMEGALADSNEAIRLDPKIALSYLLRGSIKVNKNDLDGGLVDINKSIALDPNFALSYFSRGAIKLKQDDIDGALADINKSIVLDPNFALSYAIRGGIKYKKNDRLGAIKDLEKAAQLYRAQGAIKDAELIEEYIAQLKKS
jgi:tetratricopeptide (TPR) repeat protein